MMGLGLPFSKNPGSSANSEEPTVKLKILQNPLRRKRGAEVLSAEFVQGTRKEMGERGACPFGAPSMEDKQTRLKDVKKFKNEEKMDVKRPTPRKNVQCVPAESPSGSQRCEDAPVDQSVAPLGVCLPPGRGECDSHALNMLADLALSSCGPSLAGNGRRDTVRFRPLRERRLQKGKLIHKSSDHEYHRATKTWRSVSLLGQASRPSASETMRDADSPSNPPERNSANSSQKRKVRPSVALLNEAGDFSDSSVSLISSEHSYASPVSESLKKGSPCSPSTRNGVKLVNPVPVDRKKLPFQQQLNLCKRFGNNLPLARSEIMAARLREDFTKSHRVTSCDKTVQVTFQWEAEYLFGLDSKYTNNSLEKTVIRAVHGPWDDGLSDNMEEMRLILHMWVALFYSKPFQALTVRKVVEHSNPAKYVSLNSLVDPLEPNDYCGGASVLEKRAADSLSGADQTSEVREDGPVSPSEKPLSCNELSSTNCEGDEGPFVTPEKAKDPLLKEDEESHPPAKNIWGDTVQFFDEVVGVCPVLPAENLHRGVEHGSPQTCRPEAEAEVSGDATSADALQSDDPVGLPEPSRSKQEVDVPVKSCGFGIASPSGEVKEDRLQAGGPKLCMLDAAWLEASVKSRGTDHPRQKVQDLPSLPMDEEDGDGESMEWGSIDLTLSESNDADMEPRDLDLEQESEECPEGSCVKEKKEADCVCDVASPGNGLLTSPDALSMHPASQEDKGILADSASIQASAEFPEGQTIQDKSLGSLDFLESVKTPRIPNQIDLISVSQKYSGIQLPWPASQEASPVQPEVPDEVTELSRDQEDCPQIPIDHAFSNRMDLIEDISQDSTELADSHPLHLCKPKTQQYADSVQKRESAQPEFIGSRNNLVVSTQSIALAKKIDLVEGVSLEEEGSHLDTTIHLEVSSVHQQSSDEAAKLLEDHRAQNVVQVDLVEGSSFPQEKEVNCPPDAVLMHVKEAQPVELSIAIQEDQTRQKEELRVDSPCAAANLGLASGANSENEMCCVEENISDSPKSQEIASDEEWTGGLVTVSEDINIFVGELVDTVCALVVESEEESARKNNAGLDWISSVILECVTPPESDGESCMVDQLSHVHSKWATESLERNCVFDDREGNLKASMKGQGFCSLPDENVRSHQADVFEGKGPKGNDATSIATEVFPSCGTTDQKCRLPLLETTTSPEADSSCVPVSDKVKRAHDNPEEPICDGKDRSRRESVGNMSFVPGECQTDSSEESNALIDRDTREAQDGYEELAQVESSGIVGNPEDPLLGERTQLPLNSAGMDMGWEDESPMAGSGQDPCRDLYPGRKLEGLHHTQFSAPASLNEAEYICSSGPEKEIHKDDWVSLEKGKKVSDAKSGPIKYDFPFGFKKDDWSVSHALDTDRKPGPFEDYINFSVTKKHKEKTRTFHSFSKRHNHCSGDLGLINSLNRSGRYFSDPVQNTLDMECLRFHCKVKQILKKSQLSTSKDSYTKRVPPQVVSEALPSRKVSDASAFSSPSRSRSPLLVTILNPSLRSSERCSEFFEPLTDLQDLFSSAAALRSQGEPGPSHPLHLEKLTNDKLSDFRGDVSAFVDEFAQLSRAMAFRSVPAQLHPTATSEDAAEQRCPVVPQRPAGYDVLFTELHHALHFRLRNLAQEACGNPSVFYLMETDNDPFFGRVRNLLVKGGHAEVDPAQFCKGSHLETDRLVVVIRNEDIFSHIHEVPSLLHLKHLPNVVFAGVDSPEDPLGQTYQELFLSGGFVVSDDKVLEAMTVGELKDVLKALENLNGHGGWKWLLHYRESKKLREEAREDPVARTKEGVLKSCQGANITETLYYHECDSRSCPRLERFNCLLNLQIQHISKRFAVFLTEDAGASRDALENKGILGLGVGAFIATAQEMAASFRRGLW